MKTLNSRNARRFLLVVAITAITVGAYLSSHRLRVVEALSVTTLDVAITQNFDTLPAAGSATFVNDTTLPGWYSARTGTGTTIVANDGSSNAGNLYSYGTGTNTDRALGSLGSGNAAIGNLFWGIVLTNNTGSTITSLDVAYTGEQWRNSAAAAQTVAFSYNTGASFTGSLAEFQALGTNVTQLDFTSPITGGAAAALNGNLAANRTAISFTISGLTLAAGQSIFLRWSDPDHTGADHGLSIDEFSVTPHGGVTTPTLSIGDVTMAEGNAGMTAFTFTVSLTGGTAPVGGVTFDASTQDGTANAPGDYAALVNQPGSISSGGTSTTVTVQVVGETTPETNETFFVNITNIVGANAGDVQGLGTIQNDEVTLVKINAIQGSGDTSPLVGQTLSTRGIVTLLKSNGFFLQEPDATADADPNTSEGIFVFTSSAPTALVGQDVTVTGQVIEFGTGGTNTELGNTPIVLVNSSGNSLPTPILMTTSILDPTALPTQPQLEKYEDMLITGQFRTVAPNDNFSDVDTVLISVPRPMREPGIEISLPVPPDPTSGTPDPNVPRWDENPERLSIDTNGRAGSTGLALTSNVNLGTVTGPLDFAFSEYHLIPDGTPLALSANMSAIPLPTPQANEFTVACFNIENFNNGATQRVKASLAIRNIMRYPDIIGHEEIASLAALQGLRNQVNNDAVAAGDPNPMYEAYLIPAPSGGTQHVGFLVKTTRVQTISVTQERASETYINPNTGLPETLHDRPPFVFKGTVDPSGPNPIPIIVVVNHPRSFIDIEQDPGEGPRVRAKRKAQGESIAGLLQELQTNNPGNSIMTVGDFNAFQFNDGFTDPVATIKGTPTADDQVVVDASADLVNPDFFNLTELLAPTDRYTFVFEGTPQVLDHIIVNRNALARFTRNFVAHFDADFPDTPASAFVNDISRPEGASDHDAPVAYFNLTLAPTAANGVISGRIIDSHGAPVAGTVMQLSGSDSRKAITDGQGNYRFGAVETNGFYTVTPSRSNYTMSPASKSFSLIGNRTETDFTAIPGDDNVNPLDVTEYFVRQQYLDMLGREPDQGGFNYWSDRINACGADDDCISTRRRDVAAAFFVEQEMQLTGSFVYGMYKGTLGRRPLYNEYTVDRVQVVGGSDLEARKQAFVESFVRRAEFVERYDLSTGAESFVDALVANMRDASGVDLTSLRGSLIERYNAGSSRENSRSLVVRELTENASFKQAEYNAAFVLAEYFSYLRRNPDAHGYSFWLDVLNNGDPGNYRGMVCGFINSAEYQRRFSSVVSRSDNSCSR